MPLEQVVALTGTSQLVETVNGRLYRLRDGYCLDPATDMLLNRDIIRSLLLLVSYKEPNGPALAPRLQKTDEFCCLEGTHL